MNLLTTQKVSESWGAEEGLGLSALGASNKEVHHTEDFIRFLKS